MGSAVIARTADEMEAETDVVIDAENCDVMDAKTTDEMTNEKDAEILETKTRAPPMTGEVPPHHLVSPRVCVTRTKSARSYSTKTGRGQSANFLIGDHQGFPGEAQ